MYNIFCPNTSLPSPLRSARKDMLGWDRSFFPLQVIILAIYLLILESSLELLEM